MTNITYNNCGDECVADVDASGNPLRAYVWGQGIDDLLAMTVFSPGSTNTYYAVKDHLGSVHALVDESGVAALAVTYDAWGTPQISSFIPHPSSFQLRYLFQGREYSGASGLYNFRARWYAPELGRWLSDDPIGISGGLNLYEFCGNNPVNYVDPWGEAWYDNWHFEGRDKRNGTHPTIDEVRNPGSGWELLPPGMSVFHDNSIGKPELKFIHPDGREAVYDGDTCEPVTDPRYKGTYNYVVPETIPGNWYNVLGWIKFAGKGIGHTVVDVVPYFLVGKKNERNQ